MQKKTWFLILLAFAVFGYFIASKMNPGVDTWVATNILQPIQNGLASTYNAITSSPFWQTYIAPNSAYIGSGIGFLSGIIVYRWIRRVHMPWQKKALPQTFQPQAGPPPMAPVTYTPPPVTTPTPTPITPPPTTPPPTTEKKEETKQ